MRKQLFDKPSLVSLVVSGSCFVGMCSTVSLSMTPRKFPCQPLQMNKTWMECQTRQMCFQWFNDLGELCHQWLSIGPTGYDITNMLMSSRQPCLVKKRWLQINRSRLLCMLLMSIHLSIWIWLCTLIIIDIGFEFHLKQSKTIAVSRSSTPFTSLTAASERRHPTDCLERKAIIFKFVSMCLYAEPLGGYPSSYCLNILVFSTIDMIHSSIYTYIYLYLVMLVYKTYTVHDQIFAKGIQTFLWCVHFPAMYHASEDMTLYQFYICMKSSR